MYVVGKRCKQGYLGVMCRKGKQSPQRHFKAQKLWGSGGGLFLGFANSLVLCFFLLLYMICIFGCLVCFALDRELFSAFFFLLERDLFPSSSDITKRKRAVILTKAWARSRPNEEERSELEPH